MAIRGTRRDDDLTGTSNDDVFIMHSGGNDRVDAGGGDDIIKMGATLTALDHIVGGADSARYQTFRGK